MQGAIVAHEPGDVTSPASVETSSARQPIKVATARWFGMLADDADLQFDLAAVAGSGIQPDQGLCQTQEVSWEFSPTTITHVVDNDVTRASYTPSTNKTERIHWQSQHELTLQYHELRLFDIFTRHISSWLDLFCPSRQFASIVPRLALYNVGLLNAVLTLSARYLSLQEHAEKSYGREDALQYYHESLHYIQKALQYATYHTSDELLATTIIISTFEMLDGSSRDWEKHLQGVFWIQRSQVIHGDSGGLRAAIWWAWLCQDVWAALRDHRKVFTFWKPQRSLTQLNATELASRSVFIMGRVVNYCAKPEVELTVNHVPDRVRQADELTDLLDMWHSLLTPEFAPMPHQGRPASAVFKSIWIHPPVYGMSDP